MGVAHVGPHLASDPSGVHLGSALPYMFLAGALLIALWFEFVNGFHDTANAVATAIYTHSLEPHVAVAWSGFFNFLGVVLSSGVVAFAIVSLLPVELILQVGSSAGFANLSILGVSQHVLMTGRFSADGALSPTLCVQKEPARRFDLRAATGRTDFQPACERLRLFPRIGDTGEMIAPSVDAPRRVGDGYPRNANSMSLSSHNGRKSTKRRRARGQS